MMNSSSNGTKLTLEEMKKCWRTLHGCYLRISEINEGTYSGNEPIQFDSSTCPELGNWVRNLKEVIEKISNVVSVNEEIEMCGPLFLEAYQYGKSQMKQYEETGIELANRIGFLYHGQFIIDISKDPTGRIPLTPTEAKDYYGEENIRSFVEQYKKQKDSTNKEYFEFDSALELDKHLKYWSNACGELHHHGEYDLKSPSELPEELRIAYNELWKEGYGCLEYLVEYDKKYYIALVSEFDDTFADDVDLSMDELYTIAKRNALELYHQELFRNTVLVIGKETGCQECHEVIFLVPAMESEAVYDEIESMIYENIYKTEE